MPVLGIGGGVRCFLSELPWGEISISGLQDRCISLYYEGRFIWEDYFQLGRLVVLELEL